MKLVGCDVFIYSTGEVTPDLPKQVGPLKLEFISNRGTKLWPTSAAKLDYLADEWRFRYTTPDATPLPNQHGDLDALLKELIAQGRFWTRVQVLWLLPDGSKAYSNPY